MPLTFPLMLPSNAQWQLVSNTRVFKSPLDGSVQTSESPGSHWHVSLSFTKQHPAEGRALMAFLVSLRGEAGRFYLHDHTQPTPRGTITGSPVVSGVAQIGTTINTTGWAGTLLAGDMIGIGGELKMVTADVTSAGSSAVTALVFEPPLRASPANGSAVITAAPTAIFKLTGDNLASFSVAPVFYDGLHIIAEEAF